MSTLKHILKNIQKISVSRIAGTYFRLVSSKRKDEILSLQGSFAYGGRYNPPGEFGALYLSANSEVCYAERERKAKKDTLLTQTEGKIKVSLKKVLDLTNAKNLKKLEIEKEDLVKDPSKDGWDLTWNVARIAYQCGIEAILVPSVTGKGNNLIVFDKYVTSEKIKLISKLQER